MAAEAFDPFANDDEEEEEDFFREPRSVVDASRHTSESSHSGQRPKNARDDHRADDILKEFTTTFPSLALTDSGATDQFGFPSSCFPATFEHAASGVREANERQRPVPRTLDGVTMVMGEEMSVIHKTHTNQCSVKVRGRISLEARAHADWISCDVALLDPAGHLDGAAALDDVVRPLAAARGAGGAASFRISLPAGAGEEERRRGGPLIEYTCGDRLRPVPMLITTNIQEFADRCQILFQLRVNPRNTTPLSNAVVLVAVPEDFDGAHARVSSAGRNIGTNWSDMTRILSWRLGELRSGAICEFEARFHPRESDPVGDAGGPGEAKFPVLLRYDADGGLLSDVGLEFGDGAQPSVKQHFRVYHREV